MTTLTIYRPPSTEIVTINIDEKTVYMKHLMGDHNITCEIISSSVLSILIGDYITYNSENYYINRLPDVEKINNSTFKYKIVFESVLYNLKKKLFISSDGLADYSYTGTADDFITNIVASINEIDPGWTKGTVDTSTDQTLQFSNESCHAALVRVAEAFDMEFSLSAKVISLQKSAGSATAYTFQYGRDLGLYKLERQQVRDQNIVTKVFGFGGTKNIPSSYRGRAKRLTFVKSGMAASGYLLAAASGTYGVIEGQYTDDNIYPQRTSTLTGASGIYDSDNLFDFKNSYVADSALDFDINDYLIEGLTAKIVFKSGDLSGVECEIWKYDNATKKIYYNPYSDTDGYTLPYYNSGSPVQPEIGDSYTLVDMGLPQSYIDTAEADLLDATQDYLDENSVPQVVYSVDIDPKYASSISLSLDAGDKVTIVDSDLSINSLIRVSGIEFPLVDPYRIKAVIADFVPYTLQERIVKGTKNNRLEAVFVDRRSAESARRNTMRQKQIKDMLFDTDGYFDPVNIKPLSIETAYLAVGTKSRDFWLSNVTIKANYEGDANALYVSAGSLVHLQIQITGLGYTWVIGTPLDQDSLTPATAYYLYAKCSKAALNGQWILSDSQITLEQVDGYYHFLVGMLFAVSDTYRDFDFTNGMTYISGNTITTGKIQSIDGNNYFDLTNGTVKVGNANSGFDFGVTTADVCTLKGTLVQSPAGTTAALPCFRGAYDGGTTYYKGDQVTYGGSSWNYINTSAASGQTPSEGAYYTKASSKGDTGAKGDTGDTGATGATGPGLVYRGLFSDSTTYSNNSLRRDIVKYSDTYYIYKGTDGASGAWAAGNWDSVGASFSSVATGLLFAELAYIDNLGVKHFEGTPVTAGNLTGSVVNTVANTPGIYSIVLSGTSGSVDIIMNGISKTATILTTPAAAASAFVTAYSNSFPGVTVTNPSGATITFTGGTESLVLDNFTGDIDVSGGLVQTGVKRVDTVTLSGTDGQAGIVCDTVSKSAYFNESLSQTASDFVTNHAAAYLASGAVITSDEEDIIFTADIAGVDFTGATSIVNVPVTEIGNIKIEGNSIWNDSEDSDSGTIRINLKGHNGGLDRARNLVIGNGKGDWMIYILGDSGYIYFNFSKMLLSGIPTSSTGLVTDMIYRDGNTLKIV